MNKEKQKTISSFFPIMKKNGRFIIKNKFENIYYKKKIKKLFN